MTVMTNPVPVVDLTEGLAGSESARTAAASQIGEALETIGFFYVVGHGVDWTLVETTYAQARRFFALPMDEKLALTTDDDREGYSAVGNLQYPKPGAKPSVNERFGISNEDKGLNPWPDLEGFRPALLAYLDRVRGLGGSLLPFIARALDLPDDHFAPYFTDPVTNLTLRYYPVARPEDDQWGLGAHSDGGFLTLLPDNAVPGLSIRLGPDRWADAPSLPQSFLVNSGSLLRRWTNDRFLSTEHRVLVSSVTDRYALPFFYLPTPGVTIEPLTSCVDAAHPARYEPTPFEFGWEPRDAEARDRSRMRSHRNYPEAAFEDTSALEA